MKAKERDILTAAFGEARGQTVGRVGGHVVEIYAKPRCADAGERHL